MNDDTIEVTLTAIAYQEGECWAAQCLEYDIAAQAKTLPALREELQRVVLAHISVSLELGREPFDGMQPAPKIFWDMHRQSRLKIQGDQSPFRIPKLSRFRPTIPALWLAESHACA